MKTWQKWLAGILASITILIGLGVIYQMNKEQELREEMIKIVESDEAKKLFEDELKDLDPKALTDEGIIKTYSVDYDSFNKNPIGGFSVVLILNEDINIGYRLGIDRRQPGGELYTYSWIKSDKLEQLTGE
ncbi:TPA: DUF1310 family protein [Streptococcus suis]|nr:DUF1310 family protein [Streptococcus suis]